MSFFGPQNPGIGGLEEITDAEALFLQGLASLSYAQGDILYYNGTSLTRLPKGTSGQVLKMNVAETAPEWGAGGAGAVDGSGTTNELVYWVDSDTLGSLAVATYPSLTELSYVKGVSSAIQTQINAKAAIASPTFTGTVTVPATNFTVGVSIPFSDSAGTLTLQNIDALDATTEATIEAAIDTLANLTSIQSLNVTLADAGADSLFGWDDSASAYQNLSAADARTALGLATSNTPTFTGADLSGGTTTLGTVSGAIDAGGATSLEIPNGAGGTTVNATGEVCVDSTSRTLNFYDGTTEAVLNPVQSKSITVESPTSSEDISIFYTDDAITITKLVFVITGSTSVTTTIRHHTDRNNAGNEVVTSGTVANSTTTGNVVTSFNDATVPADSFVWLETTALSGTPTSLNVTIFFRQDA